MDKILAEQPTWLIALVLIGSGIVVPIVLALIGRRRGGKEDVPAPSAPPATPIQIESPWFVQNFLQVQHDVEEIKGRLDVLSSQIAGIASLLKRRAARKPK